MHEPNHGKVMSFGEIILYNFYCAIIFLTTHGLHSAECPKLEDYLKSIRPEAENISCADELINSFKSEEEKKALEIFLKSANPRNRQDDDQLAPLFKERLDWYENGTDGSMLLEESLIKKDIKTIFDILALEGYLAFIWETRRYPKETITLGALLNTHLEKILREFFVIRFFENQSDSAEIASIDFLKKYDIGGYGMGWADSGRFIISNRLADGKYWWKALKDPASITASKDHAEYHTIRRLKDLIKQLVKAAQERPDLKKNIDVKIEEIQPKIEPLYAAHEDKEYIEIFLNKAEEGDIADKIALLQNPLYARPLAWEIDTNGTNKESIRAVLDTVARFYQKYNLYSQFIELIENLPLKPETAATLLNAPTLLHLKELGTSFLRLETALNA